MHAHRVGPTCLCQVKPKRFVAIPHTSMVHGVRLESHSLIRHLQQGSKPHPNDKSLDASLWDGTHTRSSSDVIQIRLYLHWVCAWNSLFDKVDFVVPKVWLTLTSTISWFHGLLQGWWQGWFRVSHFSSQEEKKKKNNNCNNKRTAITRPRTKTRTITKGRTRTRIRRAIARSHSWNTQ